MSSINTCSFDGYLGQDARLTFSQGGTAFLNFSVAVSSRRKAANGEWQDRTDWVDCKSIGKRAEGLNKVLRQGSYVVISGKLQQETWEKDGQKRSKLVVLVEDLSLGPKR